MLNVSVYNRHRAACPHRRSRFWKKCDCPKWVTWHREGKEHRVSAETRDWVVAAEMAHKIEAGFRGGEPPVEGQKAMLLEMAVNLYLLDKEASHLRPATLSKLKTIFEKQMLAWFRDNGVTRLRDVSLPHLQAWRFTWIEGALAAKKKQERVKGFFHFCQRNGWITQNVALGLSRIKVEQPTVEHFSEDEQRTIYAVVDQFAKIEVHRERMRAFLMLLRHSGLAIRDAVTLERSRLTADDLLILRRAKTGEWVTLPLQTNVAAFLRRTPNDNERYFFWTGNGLPKSAVADWQRALRRVFELADLKREDGSRKRCHPHMFRHSFSIDKLSKGMHVDDLANLLGHSSTRTTLKYYAPWVKARADRLNEAVRATW